MKYPRILLLVTGVVLLAVAYGCAQTHVMSLSTGKKGWLGVEIQDVTKRLKEKEKLTVSEGAYVSDVIEDSPAEGAGIKEGDVIVKLDGKSIDDGADLTNAVSKIKPKTEVKVDIVRGADKKTLTAKIGRSNDPEAFTYNFGNGFGNGYGNGWRMTMPRTPRSPRAPRAPMIPRIHSDGHFFFNDETNGLDLQNMTKQLSEYFDVPEDGGMLVASVEKGSSAEKAGFKAGDVLTKVNGDRVSDYADLHDALSNQGDKDTKCEVIRKGKSVTLTWHIEPDSGDSDGYRDDDEDEDDTSYNGMIMGIPAPHAYVHQFNWNVSPGRSVPKLHQFKEDMQNFKRELKEKLMDIKRDIRASLLNID